MQLTFKEGAYLICLKLFGEIDSARFYNQNFNLKQYITCLTMHIDFTVNIHSEDKAYIK